MGTVSTIIIICVLLISASITLILILVTVPSETDEPYEQASTFQPYSHTNRAYEIHMPIRHPPPTSTGNSPYGHSMDASINIGSISSLSTVAPTTVLNFLRPIISNHLKSSNELEVLAINKKPEVPVINKELENSVTAVTDFETTPKLVTALKFFDETTKQSRSQVAFETTTTKKRDSITLTLKFENKAQYVELKSKARKTDVEEVETSNLEFEREIKLPPEHKIVGIAFEHQSLYVGTADGKLRILNPATGEQTEERAVGNKADRIAVTQNGQIISINAQQISLFDGIQRRFHTEIPFRGKAITINDSDIYVLSKSNDAIAVFNEQLQLSHQIHFVNEAHDTCNFMTTSKQFLYISCQSAILKLTKSGQVIERIGFNKGTFSLGITFDNHSRLLAVVRGQPLLRIFQNGQLLRNAALGDEKSVIWSEVLFDGTRLHVVDYLANTLKTLRYPSDLI